MARSRQGVKCWGIGIASSFVDVGMEIGKKGDIVPRTEKGY